MLTLGKQTISFCSDVAGTFRPLLRRSQVRRSCSDYRLSTVKTSLVTENDEYKKTSVREVVATQVFRPEDKVRVQGWVKGIRRMKEFVFLEVNDGISPHRLQVVVPTDKKPKDLSIYSSVDISGVLKPSPRNAEILELHPAKGVQVVGPCDQGSYPFAGKVRYQPEYIRQYIHLRPKTNKFSAMLRLRSSVTNSIHKYFMDQEFVQIHTPIFTSNDCEGAGETFTVVPDNAKLVKTMKRESGNIGVRQVQDSEVFFDTKTFLTVSSQLHLESVVSGLGKVWSFSPVFRAENQQSTRHLSEFYMVEAEQAFCYTIEEILKPMEQMVKSCVEDCLNKYSADLAIVSEKDERLKVVLEKINSQPFTIITFDEAKRLLQSKSKSTVMGSKGLSREEELTLVEKLNDGNPMFVIDWPQEIKPFYMRECDYNSSLVSAVDLLVPGVGELCGGSLREFHVEKLNYRLARLDPSGELLNSLSWYMDFRKFGGVPTGGFGLGFDRLMLLITGQKNIKDVAPFPRWAHNCVM